MVVLKDGCCTMIDVMMSSKLISNHRGWLLISSINMEPKLIANSSLIIIPERMILDKIVLWLMRLSSMSSANPDISSPRDIFSSSSRMLWMNILGTSVWLRSCMNVQSLNSDNYTLLVFLVACWRLCLRKLAMKRKALSKHSAVVLRPTYPQLI
mgnify:FL=1